MTEATISVCLRMDREREGFQPVAHGSQTYRLQPVVVQLSGGFSFTEARGATPFKFFPTGASVFIAPRIPTGELRRPIGYSWSWEVFATPSSSSGLGLSFTYYFNPVVTFEGYWTTFAGVALGLPPTNILMLTKLGSPE